MKKADWKYLVDTLLFICLGGILFIGLLLAFVVAEGPVSDESRKYFLGLHRHQWSAIHLVFSLAFTGLLILHLALAWDWIKARACCIFKKGWRAALILTAAASLAAPLLFWAAKPKYSPEYSGYGVRDGDRSGLRIEKTESGRGTAVRPQEGRRISGTERAAAGQGRRERVEEPAASISEPETHPRENDERLLRGREDMTGSGILITGRMTLGELSEATGLSPDRILEALELPGDIPEGETLGRIRRVYGFTLQELRDRVENLLRRK